VDAAASGANGIAGRTSVCERTTGVTDERRFCVRQNRVVPAPVAGVKSAEDLVGPTGPDKTFNPPMTVTRRIRRRGEHGISRKTIVQGMPGCSDCTCMLVCACYCFFARETAGAASTRRSLRPLFSRAKNSSNDPSVSRRGVTQSRREVLKSMIADATGEADIAAQGRAGAASR
jgi:hypothetical protein